MDPIRPHLRLNDLLARFEPRSEPSSPAHSRKMAARASRSPADTSGSYLTKTDENRTPGRSVPINLRRSSRNPHDRGASLGASRTQRRREERLSSNTATPASEIDLPTSSPTVQKRNTFLYTHREYFLPLLPSHNYIRKLETNDPARDPVEYERLRSQPTGVQGTMKPYQLEGLSFLINMYRNGMSAILGDEMGLGKTLQTLALFQHIVNETDHCSSEGKRRARPFLVVCPLSVLSAWTKEAEKWVPCLAVSRFHGSKGERDKFKTACRPGSDLYDNLQILVTTYDTFAAEHSWLKRAFTFRYCVLDEGHKIKNDRSQISLSLQGLKAEYRLLLTGTPLQNNIHEMWSLLHWLYPEVFTATTADNFKSAFDLSKGRVITTFIDDARHLLELIMLRRMKSCASVALGLPPKEEILLYVPLTPMQRFWYTRLITKADNLLLDELFKGAKLKESKQLETDRALLAAPSGSTTDTWAESRGIMKQALENEGGEYTGSEWKKLMNLLMQLRKVCSHPYLLPHAGPDPYYVGAHIKTASGKFIVLDKLVDELVLRRKKKILIFSQFTKTLDFCEDLMVLKGSHDATAPFRALRFDGSTGRARRNLVIRMFNDMTTDYRVMLISTRAGGLGINLTSASDVVLMDEDWNPQVTLQAEARAHRIGQTQPVTVYKLCTQGTVEEGMLGRIRKKLYLSTKITESMQSVHAQVGKKRKHGDTGAGGSSDDGPQLDTGTLKSLVRRGAQTLARPEVDVTAMLQWDWETVLENCKDKPLESLEQDSLSTDELEQSWLNSMEKVETAVFEGKRHLKAIEKAEKDAIELDRTERRLGKNTTVMIDGFAINKESLQCADWEAVPTMAGKDARLAEPKRAKRAKISNQEHCQHCFDGGELVCCSTCPRSYHHDCLDEEFKAKLKAFGNFHCPQHECANCRAKTTEAGGLIYRCRWCERGFCEDCLDWDAAHILGPTLPELEMLDFNEVEQAWYVECHACVEDRATNEATERWVTLEKDRIQTEYEGFLAMDSATQSVDMPSPETTSEVATPTSLPPAWKAAKI